jgi:hypothetical protein
MNLFNNPSLTELSVLIARNANYFKIYDIIVDHDGEVLIEPSNSISKKILNKYKFYFTGLHGKANIGIIAAKSLRYLNQLYKNLVYCWENDMTGAIDYDKISSMQHIKSWLEINNIGSPEERSDIVSTFFKKDAHTQRHASAW